MNKLKRHIKRERSLQYANKTLGEKGAAEKVKLPDAVPEIAFLAEDINITFSGETVSINSDSLKRNINLSGTSKAHSLKSFNHKNLTVVASFDNAVIYVDSKMVTGLDISESFFLIEIDRMQHLVEINDGIEEPVFVERFYDRKGDLDNRCTSQLLHSVIKES